MIFRESRWPSDLLFQLHSDGIEAFSDSSTPLYKSTYVFPSSSLLLPWAGYLLLESPEQLWLYDFRCFLFFRASKKTMMIYKREKIMMKGYTA
jgi:hypothetical protein